jgi:hypothetical protein
MSQTIKRILPGGMVEERKEMATEEFSDTLADIAEFSESFGVNFFATWEKTCALYYLNRKISVWGWKQEQQEDEYKPLFSKAFDFLLNGESYSFGPVTKDSKFEDYFLASHSEKPNEDLKSDIESISESLDSIGTRVAVVEEQVTVVGSRLGPLETKVTGVEQTTQRINDEFNARTTKKKSNLKRQLMADPNQKKNTSGRSSKKAKRDDK